MDVCDVGRLLPTDVVQPKRQTMAAERAGKVIDLNKVEPPCRDAKARLDGVIPSTIAPAQGFRGQRGPTHVRITAPPANPGGCPLVTRHPDPAAPVEQRPAAVMVASPTKWLAGEPGPTVIGTHPAPVEVGAPARTTHSGGLPHVPVGRGFDPGAIGGKRIIKRAVVGHGLAFVRGGGRSHFGDGFPAGGFEFAATEE